MDAPTEQNPGSEVLVTNHGGRSLRSSLFLISVTSLFTEHPRSFNCGAVRIQNRIPNTHLRTSFTNWQLLNYVAFLRCKRVGRGRWRSHSHIPNVVSLSCVSCMQGVVEKKTWDGHYVSLQLEPCFISHRPRIRKKVMAWSLQRAMVPIRRSTYPPKPGPFVGRSAVGKCG